MEIGKDGKIQLLKTHREIIGYIEKEHNNGMVAYKSDISRFFSIKGLGSNPNKYFNDLRKKCIVEEYSKRFILPKKLSFNTDSMGREIKNRAVILTDFYFDNKEKIYYI